MTDSGGIRTDITHAIGITPNEVRTARFIVRDGDGVAISSFAGWAFSFFLLDSLEAANGLTALGSAKLVQVDASGQTAPNADIPFGTATFNAMRPKVYGYELWRTDAGNENRLAYGDFHIIP